MKKIDRVIFKAFSVWCRDFKSDSLYYQGSADSMLRLLNDFGYSVVHDDNDQYIYLKRGSELVASILRYAE